MTFNLEQSYNCACVTRNLIVGIIDLLCCDELDTLIQIPYTRAKTKWHRQLKKNARCVCEPPVYIIVLSANRSSVMTVRCLI